MDNEVQDDSGPLKSDTLHPVVIAFLITKNNFFKNQWKQAKIRVGRLQILQRKWQKLHKLLYICTYLFLFLNILNLSIILFGIVLYCLSKKKSL